MTSLTAILDVLGHDSDDFPVSKHLMPLDSILRRLNYTITARLEIVSHAARFGTVHGAPSLDDPACWEDLDVLESFLIGNAANWPLWTDEVSVSLTETHANV